MTFKLQKKKKNQTQSIWADLLRRPQSINPPDDNAALVILCFSGMAPFPEIQIRQCTYAFWVFLSCLQFGTVFVIGDIKQMHYAYKVLHRSTALSK